MKETGKQHKDEKGRKIVYRRERDMKTDKRLKGQGSIIEDAKNTEAAQRSRTEDDGWEQRSSTHNERITEDLQSVNG
jgi:hypothetical protein